MATRRKSLFGRKTQRFGSFAMIQPKITATATSGALQQTKDVKPGQKRRRRDIGQLDRSWQTEAFEYARQVGELGFLLNLQANVVALCGLPIRRYDEKESAWLANDPNFDDDGKLIDDGYDDRPHNVMRAFVGPTGGTPELVRRAAWNLFAAGEVNLLGSPSDGENGILWEFLSIRELFPSADGALVRQRAGLGSMLEPLGEDTFTARLWRSSAEFSDLADCEVRRVLPILQEIVVLTMMVDAVIKSRIPANMLFMPEEITFAGQTPAPTDGTVGDGDVDDEFIEEMFDHLTAPIDDPSSSARLMPLVLRGKAEFADAIKVIELARTVDLSARDVRQEALGRLAQGLDAPPEIIAGKTSANHWTAANIDSEFVVKHIQPVGQLIADFITVAYLRPMLEAYEDMKPEEAALYKVEFDPSPVIARADEASSARDLAEWLSDEALLAANGFTKSDMADKETVRQRRLWTLVKTHPTVFGKLLTLLPGFEDIDPELLEVKTLEHPGEEDTASTDDSELEPSVEVDENEIVDETSGMETPERPVGLALITERLAVAADRAVLRAVERAGSKVVSLSQRDPDMRDRLRVSGKDRVMALVTPSDLTRMGVSPDMLLTGAWDAFANDARTWVHAHLEANGVAHREAADGAALTVHQLCEGLDGLVKRSMFAPLRRHSNGLLVPTELVTQALEQAAYAQAV